jgi:hypothetical protein
MGRIHYITGKRKDTLTELNKWLAIALIASLMLAISSCSSSRQLTKNKSLLDSTTTETHVVKTSDTAKTSTTITDAQRDSREDSHFNDFATHKGIEIEFQPEDSVTETAADKAADLAGEQIDAKKIIHLQPPTHTGPYHYSVGGKNIVTDRPIHIIKLDDDSSGEVVDLNKRDHADSLTARIETNTRSQTIDSGSSKTVVHKQEKNKEVIKHSSFPPTWAIICGCLLLLILAVCWYYRKRISGAFGIVKKFLPRPMDNT